MWKMERNTNNILDIHTHKAEPVSAGKAIINRKLATDALCEGYFYSAGIHPWDLTEFDTERRLECLREQLAEKQLVAVGEAGLDKLAAAPMQLQVAVFKEQVELSEKYELPLIIHCVKAMDELLALRKERAPKQPWIWHGFRGKPEQAKQLLQKGFYLSFGMHYSSEAMNVVPDSRLFLETDDSPVDIEDVLRDAVSSEAPLLQRYVIRRVLEQLAGKRKDLTREHLESVRELFEKQVGKSVCLPYGITAVRGYETLRLEKQGVHLKEERKRKSGEEVPIPVPAGWKEEKSLAFAENPVTIVKKTSVFPERIEEKKYTKCFDCDKIKDGLVLRTRRSGDYLRVTAKGGKKKLKDYMIDAKIPKEERDSILLLADGPEIWWVVGYRRGESGRVGEDTKAVLQIQIGVGKEENR